MLDEPNSTTELSSTNATINTSIDPSLRVPYNGANLAEITDFLNSTDLYMGVSLDDIWSSVDLPAMSSHQ